jgi:hypothetical protein
MISIYQIMDYENGLLDNEASIAMFQDMINDGSVWSLQGHYGRTAVELIKSGVCTRPKLGEEVFQALE